MKIEIKSLEVAERRFTGKDGSARVSRTQEAYVDLGHSYPDRFSVQLWERSPFPLGSYEVTPKSFFVDRFGNLSLRSTLDLVSVRA